MRILYEVVAIWLLLNLLLVLFVVLPWGKD
jgi:hypothetical protein